MLPLTNHLTQLEASGLIHLAEVQPTVDYAFRHALMQDAAYGSLLKADRRVLHQHAGEALLALYPEREAELAPLLAEHFAKAGEAARAVHYYILAAEAAGRVHANAEAAQFYDRALALVKGPTQTALQIRLGLGRGRALELSNQHPAALNSYLELEAHGQALGDQALVLAFTLAQATLRATYTSVADFALGQALAEKALGLARALGDKAAEAKAYWNLLLAHRSASHTQLAVEAGEQGLALARQENLLELQAYLLTDVAAAYLFLNRTADAKAGIAEAIALWRTLGNPVMLAEALNRQAMAARMMGEPQAAIPIAQEALTLNRQMFNAWGEAFSLMVLGLTWMELGHVQQAIEHQRTTLALSRQHQLPFPPISVLPASAKVYFDLGAHDLAQAALAQLRELAPTAPPMQLSARIISAYFALKQGQPAEVAALLRDHPTTPNEFLAPFLESLQAELKLHHHCPAEALTHLEALTHRTPTYFWVYGQYLAGQALRALGRDAEAQARWLEAVTVGEQRELRPYTWQVLASLSDLAHAQGQPTAAADYRSRARACLTYILDHCPLETQAQIRQTPLAQKVIGD